MHIHTRRAWKIRSEGIPIHFDPHHIFAVQLFGDKKWR
ncbi:MAG TPA: hypothetical protein EYO95_10800, partial [Methylophaga sp.]|nr:hypothetical protein [Methylophaga sp.]